MDDKDLESKQLITFMANKPNECYTTFLNILLVIIIGSELTIFSTVIVTCNYLANVIFTKPTLPYVI